MLVSDAIKAAGYEGKVKIAMDCAATEFYGERGGAQGHPFAAPSSTERKVGRQGWPCRCVQHLRRGLTLASCLCFYPAGEDGKYDLNFKGKDNDGSQVRGWVVPRCCAGQWIHHVCVVGQPAFASVCWCFFAA